jgi:hypothetical protein
MSDDFSTLCPDDRVHCDRDCADYIGSTGQCRAALQGRYLLNGIRLSVYHPSLGTPRRCECFKPKAGAEDQRTPAQRWPRMFKP